MSLKPMKSMNYLRINQVLLDLGYLFEIIHNDVDSVKLMKRTTLLSRFHCALNFTLNQLQQQYTLSQYFTQKQ